VRVLLSIHTSVVLNMQAASAPAKNNNGGGGEWPPLPVTPPNPIYIPLPDNHPEPSTSASVPISISAAQFDSFENSFNSNSDHSAINAPVAPSLHPRREVNSAAFVVSPNLVSCDGSVPRSHSRPILINSCVSDIYEPMVVGQGTDGARHKRTMLSLHSNEIKENSKTKKLITNGISPPSDTANSGKAHKIQYSNTGNPPFAVHVHSTAENPAKLLHPLLISRSLSKIAYSNIKEIKKIGKDKVLAEMASAKAANDLTNNCSLQKEDLKGILESSCFIDQTRLFSDT